MEPTAAPIKIFVGDFEVVHVSGMAITLHIGKHVHATTIHGDSTCRPWINISPMT
jgi:hypothetical protein